MVAVVLLVLLAALGVTIVRIGQLIWLHLFLGLLLLGPVAAKLASTGYRFLRYYSHNPPYRLKGPPRAVLRAVAPMVVLSTLVVFATGVLLLAQGTGSRDRWLFIHKASFVVWLAFTAIHVLAYLPGLGGTLRAGVWRSHGVSGEAGRWIAVAGALVGGLVLALVLVPQFGVWTSHGRFEHFHQLSGFACDLARVWPVA